MAIDWSLFQPFLRGIFLEQMRCRLQWDGMMATVHGGPLVSLNSQFWTSRTARLQRAEKNCISKDIT